MAANGVFCLEGEWDPDLTKRASVLPVLELLERLGEIKQVHRDVATVGELEHYLAKWRQQRYKDYRVLYLAAHGDKGSLSLSPDNGVEIDEIADMVGEIPGRYVYFGSCLTMFNGKDATRFLEDTGAAGVLGYRREVDWVEGAAFEVILLSWLANHGVAQQPETLFKQLMRRHGALARLYKFVMVTRNGTLRSQDWAH